MMVWTKIQALEIVRRRGDKKDKEWIWQDFSWLDVGVRKEETLVLVPKKFRKAGARIGLMVEDIQFCFECDEFLIFIGHESGEV